MTKKIVQKNELDVTKGIMIYIQEKNQEGKWITKEAMPIFPTHYNKDGYPILKATSKDGTFSISGFKLL